MDIGKEETLSEYFALDDIVRQKDAFTRNRRNEENEALIDRRNREADALAKAERDAQLAKQPTLRNGAAGSIFAGLHS